MTQPDGAPPPPLEPEPPPAPRLRSRARHVQLALLATGCVAIVAVDLHFIEAGPVRAEAVPRASAPAASAAPPSSAQAEGLAEPIAAPEAPSEPAPEAAADPAAEVDEPPEEAPPPEKRAARKAGMTVEEVAKRACSTAPLDGLNRQIVAESQCLDDSAFARVPARKNLDVAGHVFLYLDAPARDHLVRVLDAQPRRVMKVHSALRTVAQQYLLSRWAAAKRCGIQLATRPGESNHETGLALDVGEPGAWRSALESEGFHWLGSIDRVHFDFVGPGASPHPGLDIQAFQRLWNRNHPDDAIVETKRYDAPTEIRLKRSPAGGFPIGARCPREGRGARAAALR